MGKVSAWKIVLCCSLLLAANSRLWGQGGNQGSVEGTIVDQKGGAVPEVALTLKNLATGVTLSLTGDAEGFFKFAVVPVGTYELTAQKAGFSTVTQKGVTVTVGARLNLNFTLPLAAQQITVEVTSDLPLVETTRSHVSSTVDSQSVANLPVLGRNFINFVLLTPGVTLDRRDGDISFAGQRGTLNSLVVDGGDSNNTFFGQTTGRTGSGRAPYQFSQDAVAEFQVNSNGYSAEFGRAGGAVINVITKSGTNALHGTAFEFYRDTSLNAQDSITKSQKKPKAPLHFHQFGGNLGGPVVKDKLFFFFDYDGQRNTLPNTVVLNLPAMFAPSTLFETHAFNYLTARAGSWTRTQNQDVYLGKVDWFISQNHQLSGRINSQRFTGNNFEAGGQTNALEHTGASLVTTDTVSTRLTSTISSKSTNVASFSYLRDNEPGQANSPNAQGAVLQPGVGTVLTVGRNFFSPRFTNITRQQWADTVSLVQGRHSLKAGVDFIRDQIANFFPGNFSGNYTFTNLDAFGRSLDRAPQLSPGNVTYVQAFAGAGTGGPTTNPNLFESSLFLQDEWRMRKNLTLNLGVRYDVQRVAQPVTANPQALAAGINTGHIENPANTPEPRIGFAWTPLSGNRMVLRGGYGIFYGRTPSIMYGTAMSNNGLNVATFQYDGSTAPFYPDNVCGAPDPAGTSPSCAHPPGGTSGAPIIFSFDPFYKQPMVQQWSLGLEHQFLRDFSINVSYLGVHGTHLQRTRDINLNPNLIPGHALRAAGGILDYTRYSSIRPIPAFNRISQFEGSASSLYHGLAVQVSKRYRQGFQFLASYTWSHVIDDNPDATAVVPFTFDDAKTVQFPTIPGADRGNGQNDQRHRFVVSGIWNLDSYTKGMAKAPRLLLGGWELSGIFTIQSGQPYTALVAGDLNFDGNSRAARLPGVGRNTFYLPKNASLDPRITKDIPLREKMKFQLILEAFNLFNRNNVFSVNTDQFTFTKFSTKPPICLNSDGCISFPVANFGVQNSNNNTPISPRIVQLGAKFIF